MESDDELAEDEEEILVYVEFDGFIDGNAFSEEKLQLDMIGIDTERPIMQINGRFYEGSYEDVVGTYMFFTKNDNTAVDDPVFDTAPTLKYFAKTRKALKMQRIFIKPRTEVLGDSEHSECIPNLNTLKKAGVPLKYQEEALCFWKSLRDNRLNALNTYLEKHKIRAEKKSKGIPLDSESDEDSPFAAYRLKNEFKDSDDLENDDTELENDDASHDKDTHLSKHIPSKAVQTELTSTSKDINPKDLESLTITDHVPSTSKSDSTCVVNPVENPKIKIIPPRRKKGKVIHDVRKKKGKKKGIAKTEEKKIKTVTEELHEEELAENNPTELLSMPDATEIEHSETNDNQTETLKQPQPEIDESIPTDRKVLKQQKREAKMKEISERLKIIAEEYINKKMD